MNDHTTNLDALDIALLEALYANPRAGALDLSRQLRVARATVQTRLRRLEEVGIVSGFSLQIDVAALGFDVQAFVTLEILQGALDAVRDHLQRIPGVLEAFSTTGSGDMLCRVAAESHGGLQETLLQISRCPAIARSMSVIVLDTVVPYRSRGLLSTLSPRRASKAPAYRAPSPDSAQK